MTLQNDPLENEADSDALPLRLQFLILLAFLPLLPGVTGLVANDGGIL